MEDLLGLAEKGGYTPDDLAKCKQRLIVKLASSEKQDKKMVDFLQHVQMITLSKFQLLHQLIAQKLKLKHLLVALEKFCALIFIQHLI